MVEPSVSGKSQYTVTDGTGDRIYPGRSLVSAEAIRTRVAQLADEILNSYKERPAELVIVAIMTGAMMFLADLVRAIRLPTRIGIMMISSYPGPATQSQGVRLVCDVEAAVEGKDVVILDDILETGRTLAKAVGQIRGRRPRSVKTCVLLEKEQPQPPEVAPDFIGFVIPDEFVVGYGLDYDNLFRNYPEIAVLERDRHGG